MEGTFSRVDAAMKMKDLPITNHPFSKFSVKGVTIVAKTLSVRLKGVGGRLVTAPQRSYFHQMY
jgi:hypothetical protein